MFTKSQLAKWESFGFVFPPEYNEWASTDPPKEEKPSPLEVDEEKYETEYNDNPIVVNGVTYNFKEIRRRVNEIKRKVQPFYNKLSSEEKFILDLPLVEWKLNYKHGAVMIVHWLEASGESIKLDYDFFMSEDRVKNIDSIAMRTYLFALENDAAEKNTLTEELKTWLAWARDKADWYDPMVNKPDDLMPENRVILK